MSELPQDTLTPQELFEWYALQEQLSVLKQREHFMRMRIFRHLVPLPEEGTNSVVLSQVPAFAGSDMAGGVLKAVHKIMRDIDEAALMSLQETFVEKKLPLGSLIKFKPELVLKAYRKLTEEERKIFDQALIVKPGSPQVEIVIPKAKA